MYHKWQLYKVTYLFWLICLIFFSTYYQRFGYTLITTFVVFCEWSDGLINMFWLHLVVHTSPLKFHNQFHLLVCICYNFLNSFVYHMYFWYQHLFTSISPLITNWIERRSCGITEMLYSQGSLGHILWNSLVVEKNLKDRTC